MEIIKINCKNYKDLFKKIAVSILLVLVSLILSNVSLFNNQPYTINFFPPLLLAVLLVNALAHLKGRYQIPYFYALDQEYKLARWERVMVILAIASTLLLIGMLLTTNILINGTMAIWLQTCIKMAIMAVSIELLDSYSIGDSYTLILIINLLQTWHINHDLPLIIFLIVIVIYALYKILAQNNNFPMTTYDDLTNSQQHHHDTHLPLPYAIGGIVPWIVTDLFINLAQPIMNTYFLIVCTFIVIIWANTLVTLNQYNPLVIADILRKSNTVIGNNPSGNRTIAFLESKISHAILSSVLINLIVVIIQLIGNNIPIYSIRFVLIHLIDLAIITMGLIMFIPNILAEITQIKTRTRRGN